MAIKALYTVKATASGGRDGQVSTADGSFSAKLSTPREMGGGGGPGNNPGAALRQRLCRLSS